MLPKDQVQRSGENIQLYYTRRRDLPIYYNTKIKVFVLPDINTYNGVRHLRAQNSIKFPLPPIFTSAALCILGTQPAQSPRIPPSAKIFANA